MRGLPAYRLIIVGMMVTGLLHAQDVPADSVSVEKVPEEMPVYKPVISLSYGVVNFRGDVRNSLLTSAVGNSAGMINVATFIDRKKHYFVANFNFLLGKISVNEYSHSDLSRNLNFETSLYSFGINAEYRFGHLIRKTAFIRPYVSVGIENMIFSSKGDLRDAGGQNYHYWSDGSIRNQPEENGDLNAAELYRDYSYETDLRTWEEQEFGLGKYNEHSLAFPVGIGAHFLIGRRSFFSLGLSYHYALTDYLDNVAHEGTSIQGKKGNDSYVYSHISLHFDLFSDPNARTVDLMFTDVGFDPLFYADEDGDQVLDINDHCPFTPAGLAVDSVGCPLDGDGDGVPDFRDREADTAPGVWVDEEGVTMTEEDFYARIESRNNPMDRSEVELYLSTIMDEYRYTQSTQIPEKFKSLDEDEDGYISFDELMVAVDLYFDFKLDLEISEIRELNDFFFAQ